MWKRTRHKIIVYFKCNSTLTVNTPINWITDYFTSHGGLQSFFFHVKLRDERR